jgi:hypothetical protein
LTSFIIARMIFTGLYFGSHNYFFQFLLYISALKITRQFKSALEFFLLDMH